MPIYRGRDEQGRVVVVAGVGDTGTGDAGVTGNDGRMRAARNRLDESSAKWLKMRFDPPGDGLELEGISGPGDSGGPGFLEVDGKLWLAGVSSAQSTRSTGGRENVYGVVEYYTRVSSYAAWLDEVTAPATGEP